MTKIKICGLRTPADIAAANESRPDYIGFILSPGYRRSITKEQAQHHPNKHMLLRALGVEETVRADIFGMTWQTGDCLLICSDGLYGAFDIESVLAQIDVTKDKNEILNALVKMAVDYGSKDDITGILAWQSALDTANFREV